MKKPILIVATIILIIGLLITGYWLATRQNIQEQTPAPSDNTNTTIPPDQIRPDQTPPSPIEDTLDIQTPSGSITVKNFYKDPEVKTFYYGAVLGETSLYRAFYSRDYGYFVITITSDPIAKAQQEGEEMLLKRLDITASDACKLDVRIAVLPSVDPDYEKKNYAPTFCSR